MSISREEVFRVARLAHLHLSEEETEHMVTDMNRILEYAKRLDTVVAETTGDRIETGERIPLRADEAQTWLLPGEATAGSPGAENNLFKVPPVFGGDPE